MSPYVRFARDCVLAYACLALLVATLVVLWPSSAASDATPRASAQPAPATEARGGMGTGE